MVLHLPDPEDVLLVAGRLRDLGGPRDVPDVVAAFAAKYTAPGDEGYLPGVDPGVDVVYALEPGRPWPGGWPTSRTRSSGGRLPTRTVPT